MKRGVHGECDLENESEGSRKREIYTRRHAQFRKKLGSRRESSYGNYLDFVLIRLNHSLRKTENFESESVYPMACHCMNSTQWRYPSWVFQI